MYLSPIFLSIQHDMRHDSVCLSDKKLFKKRLTEKWDQFRTEKAAKVFFMFKKMGTKSRSLIFLMNHLNEKGDAYPVTPLFSISFFFYLLNN